MLKTERLMANSGEKPDFLFLVTEIDCPENIAVGSTLAWLARKNGMIFDAYVCAPNPHSGYWHQEQFYFTMSFYALHFCSITRRMPRFRRAASVIGKIVFRDHGFIAVNQQVKHWTTEPPRGDQIMGETVIFRR